MDLKEEDNKLIADVIITIKYNYKLKVKDAKVKMLSTSTIPIKEKEVYNLTFIKQKEESKDNKCSRCGAPIEENKTGICEYCKSKLINENNEWIIYKEEKIS